MLIIGYGNPLRSDDGIGQVVAAALAERWNNAEVITAHQLTPELAARISHAESVVFIDARADGEPGSIASAIVMPLYGAGAFTHNVTPASLLAAAHDLYGTAPAGLLISIAGASFEFGTGLSPALNAILPDILADIDELITREKAEHHA